MITKAIPWILGEAEHGHKMDGKKVWEFDLGFFFLRVVI